MATTKTEPRTAVAHDLDGAPRSPSRVIVVDDHAVFAEALALSIDASAYCSCVGTAADVDEALALAEETAPDVAIVDVYLGTADGIDGTRRLRARHPETQVIVLTGQLLSRSLVVAAAEAGASALLPKSASLKTVVDLIPGLGDSTIAFDRRMLLGVLSETKQPAESPPRARSNVLTGREQQLLDLLAHGVDVTSAALRLGIRTTTCRGYAKSLYAKLGVHSQLEAVAVAREQGLLDGSTA